MFTKSTEVKSDRPFFHKLQRRQKMRRTIVGSRGGKGGTSRVKGGHLSNNLGRLTKRLTPPQALAMAKLPPLVPAKPDAPTNAAEIPLRRTGTEGAPGVVPGVVPAVVTGGIGPHRTAPMCTFGSAGGTLGDSPQPLEMQQPGIVLRQVASVGRSEDDGTRTRNHRIDSPVL